MTATPTLEETVEHLDFEEQNYNTTLEAVQEYGVPVVEAGGFEREEETLVTGRTVDRGMQFDEEAFSKAAKEKSNELINLYHDAGVGGDKARRDFSAAFGVALVNEVDEDLINEAKGEAYEASGSELGRNYLEDSINAALDAYEQAASQEAPGTDGILDG